MTRRRYSAAKRRRSSSPDTSRRSLPLAYAPEYSYREGVIFGLCLPFALAPTLNAYANAEVWEKARWRKNVDSQILAALLNIRPYAKVRYPATHKEVCEAVHGEGLAGTVRRKVVVTRYSSREPDEIGADVIGGKVGIDRLKQCGLLMDDNRKWCQREALWVKASPKFGYVSLEVMVI